MVNAYVHMLYVQTKKAAELDTYSVAVITLSRYASMMTHMNASLKSLRWPLFDVVTVPLLAMKYT